ncbi:MAG: hypothetical protein JSR93_06490 [Verrucomicrobia bacterium]|nr:hypothetical protein [Verrucomicrobiota bacterium]
MSEKPQAASNIPMKLDNQGGSYKTALPGKIDDFEASYKWQRSCHAPFDEVGPK